MADDLRLVAKFDDKASAGVRKLGKDLAGVKPTHGMAQAQKWFDEFRGSADRTAGVLRPISGYMGAIGVGGLAAGVSIGEMVKQFKELANQTLALKEIGRQTGLTTTEVKRLKYAASELSIDPEKMVAGLRTMSDKMFDFRRHVGDLYGQLNQFDPDFARKLSLDGPEQALKDYVGWLAKIKDPQLQRRWAEIGLGDGDLSRLAATPGEFSKAMDDAARAVPEVTKAMEDQAKLLNQAVVNLNQSWDNLKNDVGPSVIHGMTEATDKLREAFDAIHKHPAEAGIAAAGAGALYARYRIMRGSGLAGGAGLNRAAGNLTGSADALKEAAAELRGRGGSGGGPGGSPEEPGKSGGSSPGFMSLVGRAGILGWLMTSLADGMPDQLNKAEKDYAPDDPELDREAAMGDRIRQWFRGGALETDGNALHRNDGDLFQKVRQGSKEGIVQGLREMAQEQELAGGVPSIGPGDGGGGRPGGGAGMPSIRYGRNPASGGYRHGPGTLEGGPNGAFNPQAPTNPGTYRPQYKLSDADLDDRVVNTIAGEATSSPESIDAVVNNMLNRVGSKGWGPSGNLLQVARAPGQYAGYRKANPETAARIRDRIRAIASGGVADNTNGSNAYRAAWYHGKWYQQHAADGRVVGGNRFAYEPWTKNGPYAPYPASETAADAFKAHQKALNGTPPQAHASGGPIRGPGGPRSDSIFAMLSNGEFVVNARDAQRHAGLLQAINSGGMPAYADGGFVRRKSWLDFFHRSMGASRPVALGAAAMMMGESGRGLNPGIYGWDVNGPSGGTAQWHDVTRGPGAGRVHRLSDMMAMAMQQHVDWKDVSLQQAWWKHEAKGPLAYAWNAMRHANTAAGALKAGIDKFEVPADRLGELHKRLPNIVRLARESGAGASTREIDPIRIDFHHHQDGRVKSIRTKSNRGVHVHLARGPTFASASETD